MLNKPIIVSTCVRIAPILLILSACDDAAFRGLGAEGDVRNRGLRKSTTIVDPDGQQSMETLDSCELLSRGLNREGASGGGPLFAFDSDGKHGRQVFNYYIAAEEDVDGDYVRIEEAELVASFVVDRDFFRAGDVGMIEFETHHGYEISVAYWGTKDCNDEIE